MESQTQNSPQKKASSQNTVLPAEPTAQLNTICKMYLKIHSSYRNVVAICDADLIGKKFEEGKRQLDLRENFYKSPSVFTKEQIIKIIQQQIDEDATFNIVGPKATQASIEAGLLTKQDIDKIQDIPFALTLL